MKYLINACLFTTIMLILNVSHAQDWAPVGATWYYQAQNGWFGGETYTTISVVEQDSMNGVLVSELAGNCHQAYTIL